jgi:hypothetical protein
VHHHCQQIAFGVYRDVALAALRAQRGGHALPDAIIAPRPKLLMYARPRRKVRRQLPPMALLSMT